MAAAEEKFETHIKVQFDGVTEVVIPVPGLRNDATQKIKGGYMIVPADVVKTIFEPVVSAICTLLLRQIKISDGVKAILAVGGLGSNDYPLECLKDVHQCVDNRIMVLEPQHA